MSTCAVLVLDDVGDVDRLVGELVVGDEAAKDQQIIDTFSDDINRVVRGGDYYPKDTRDGRLYIEMLCNYWYPDELHYSPGNWEAISRLCHKLWEFDPAITIHYMHELNLDTDLAPDELVKGAHRLTVKRVAELDDVADREMQASPRNTRVTPDLVGEFANEVLNEIADALDGLLDRKSAEEQSALDIESPR